MLGKCRIWAGLECRLPHSHVWRVARATAGARLLPRPFPHSLSVWLLGLPQHGARAPGQTSSKEPGSRCVLSPDEPRLARSVLCTQGSEYARVCVCAHVCGRCCYRLTTGHPKPKA